MCRAEICEGQVPSAFPVFLPTASPQVPVILCLLKVTVITKACPRLHSIILALGFQHMNLGMNPHSVRDISFWGTILCYQKRIWALRGLEFQLASHFQQPWK